MVYLGSDTPFVTHVSRYIMITCPSTDQQERNGRRSLSGSHQETLFKSSEIRSPIIYLGSVSLLERIR